MQNYHAVLKLSFHSDFQVFGEKLYAKELAMKMSLARS